MYKLGYYVVYIYSLGGTTILSIHARHYQASQLATHHSKTTYLPYHVSCYILAFARQGAGTLNTYVRDRNSGNFGFLDVLQAFTVLHWNRGRANPRGGSTYANHVTSSFPGTKFHSMKERSINSPRLRKDTIEAINLQAKTTQTLSFSICHYLTIEAILSTFV